MFLEAFENVSGIYVLYIMFAVTVVSVLPYIPGPPLVWLIGVLYAVATGFDRITPLAVLLMTILMLAGVTSSFWLTSLGMQSQGTSCMTTLATLLGGLVGTFFIPLPIIGTLIGMVLGALFMEFMQQGKPREALRAGGNAFKTYLTGCVFDMSVTMGMVIIFAASLYITGD